MHMVAARAWRGPWLGRYCACCFHPLLEGSTVHPGRAGGRRGIESARSPSHEKLQFRPTSMAPQAQCPPCSCSHRMA